jgi:hypothetical protein
MSGDNHAFVGSGDLFDETGEVLPDLGKGDVPRHVQKYVQIF